MPPPPRKRNKSQTGESQLPYGKCAESPESSLERRQGAHFLLVLGGRGARQALLRCPGSPPDPGPVSVYSLRLSALKVRVQLLRFLCFIFAIFFVSVSTCAAQSGDAHPNRLPVTDVVVLRTALATQQPFRTNYRLIEWNQQRGRWLLPDIGYYDNGYFGHQLWFGGGGAELLHRPHMVWTEELYANQAAGKGTHNERMFWFWTVFDFKLRPGLTAQLVGYPTLPLNHAQDWGMDIDRGKLEWEFKHGWKIGPGYAATSFTDQGAWESRPFLTMTHNSGHNTYEVWAEKIAGGAQIQLRYMLVRDEKVR